ncbi:MAG TPA: response regulator [Candidatus Saccharimonadales bacterium]|nr:response regulator [Candidatus Saccharimonadales bacterium]
MASKILLVEDDNNLREIYEARLQAEGYTIVTAKDGEEALVVAKAEKPDLIISDVMMPRISGFEMLDILRNTEELKYTKVIMLTALGQADDKTRADSLGADRYLVKSQVTLEDIVKAAHELTDAAPAPAAGTAPAATAVTPVAAAMPVATPPATSPIQAVPVAMEPAQPPTATPVIPTAPAAAPEPVAMPVATPPAPTPIAPSLTASPTTPSSPTVTASTAEPPVAASTPPVAAPPANDTSTPAVISAPSTNANPTIPSSETTAAPTPGPEPTISLPTAEPIGQTQPTAAPAVPAEPAVAPSAPAAAPSPAASTPRPSFMTDFSAAASRAPAASTLAPASEITASDTNAAPMPVAAPEPSAAVTTDVADNATPSADEKATVGAQIADFANAPASSAPTPTGNHDAALDSAVESLSSKTAPAEPEEVVAPTSPNNDSVTISGKKVIQPIPGTPKPDLNELLAREEAKEASPGGLGAVVTPTSTSPTPTAQPSMPPAGPPAPHNDFDPNNIAL